MSQKPVNKRSQHNTREALWAVMLKLKSFTAVELAKHSTYKTSSIRPWLKGLTAAGYLTSATVESTPCVTSTTYTIDPETAPQEPPRVREDGTVVTQGMGRHNMWRTMKMLKEFTLSQLIAFATTEKCTIAIREAEYYCEYLTKAGYIAIVDGVSPPTWRFNADRYTGPKAPMIQKVLNVYDQNTGKVVWQSGKGGTP
jgi:hypothetical protein